MKLAVVIPARLSSKRLPRKALADICGKPMVVHVYRRAVEAGIGDVYIATDSLEIKKAAEAHGAKVILTGEASSGSHRVFLASQLIDADVFLNLQGDEPLIDPRSLRLLRDGFFSSKAHVGTLAHESPVNGDFNNPNVVKVVTDRDGFALYFSRSPIPYGAKSFLKHIGVYIYTREVLEKIFSLEPSPLEELEGLEQLRFLYYGFKIKVVKTPYDSIGVDTKEDLERVRRIMEVG